MEADPAVLEPLDPAHDHFFFQLETRNAVSQQPAGAVVAVVDMHVIAGDPQIFGGGQPGWPGTDDADRLAFGATGLQRFDPTFFPGGVGDIFFHRTDGDRAVTGKFDHAIALAQAVLRADAATDFRHGRGQVRHFIGFAQTPLGGQAEPVGDMIVQRAVDRTIRHAALRAAGGLFRCLVRRIAVGDFLKILCAQIRVALFRVGLALLDKFQHFQFLRAFCHARYSFSVIYECKQRPSPAAVAD